MVSVASLLNPEPPSSEGFWDSPRPGFKSHNQSLPSLPRADKQKMSKAAATFVKGKPKGQVNYPPYEIQDQVTALEHKKFEVQPIGCIEQYPKTVPYKSEKKGFLQKTGMAGFEVFQYTFKMPDDAREKDSHTMMWDYNVGLVRITTLFKSLKHPKTMPAKVMLANPGLREISYSITGGSIAAQGYWVPFEAAKAVAAKFCYKIRYALVPVFGPDFVSMCHSSDEPSVPNLRVQASIIRQCTETMTAHQARSRESSVAVSPRTTKSNDRFASWPPKLLETKTTNATDEESGYGTDSERSDKYQGFPDSPRSIGWTPVNTPRLAHLETYQFLQQPPRDVTSTPRALNSSSSSRRKPMTSTKRIISEVEEASAAEGISNNCPLYASTSPKRRKISPAVTPELGAAYALMELSMADATGGVETSMKRRRASA